MRLTYLAFESPIGWIAAAETSRGIALVEFLGPGPESDAASGERVSAAMRASYPDAVLEPGAGVLCWRARAHIIDYLQKRTPVPELPFDLRKGSSFDRSIWKAIGAIPFGETRTYKEISAAVGVPAGARAAGNACGRNPVPILIPCHRVVASGGKLGGFSGGLDIKRALLGLESETVWR